MRMLDTMATESLMQSYSELIKLSAEKKLLTEETYYSRKNCKVEYIKGILDRCKMSLKGTI